MEPQPALAAAPYQDVLTIVSPPATVMLANGTGTEPSTQPTTPAEPPPPVMAVPAAQSTNAKKRVQIITPPSSNSSSKRMKSAGTVSSDNNTPSANNTTTAVVDGQQNDDDDSSSAYMMPTAARRPRMTDGLTAEQFERDMLEIEAELNTMGKGFQLPASLADEMEHAQPALMKYWTGDNNHWTTHLRAEANVTAKSENFIHERMIAMSSVYLIPKAAYAQYKLDHPHEDPKRLEVVLEQARIEAKTRKPLGADDIRLVDDEADYAAVDNNNGNAKAADRNQSSKVIVGDSGTDIKNEQINGGSGAVDVSLNRVTTRASQWELTTGQPAAPRTSRRLAPLLSGAAGATRRPGFGQDEIGSPSTKTTANTNRRRNSRRSTTTNTAAAANMRPPAADPSSRTAAARAARKSYAAAAAAASAPRKRSVRSGPNTQPPPPVAANVITSTDDAFNLMPPPPPMPPLLIDLNNINDVNSLPVSNNAQLLPVSNDVAAVCAEILPAEVSASPAL